MTPWKFKVLWKKIQKLAAQSERQIFWLLKLEAGLEAQLLQSKERTSLLGETMSLRGERMMKVAVAQFYGIALLSGKEEVQRGGGSNLDTENCSDKDEDDNVGNTEGESISDVDSQKEEAACWSSASRIVFGGIFRRRPKSQVISTEIKGAILEASAAVVAIITYAGGKLMTTGSGTIIGCEDVNGTYISTILTSATLLRSSWESDAIEDDIKVKVYLGDGKFFLGYVSSHDFHFNIATINVTSDVALPTASLRPLDDNIPMFPSETTSLQSQRHLDSFKIRPGDVVVALGRFGGAPRLWYARGEFRQSCRPWIGMALSNLYAARIGKLENVISKFNISEGVLVDEVIKGSPAEQAGIRRGDVIVQCGKKFVHGFLEFYDVMWKKVGKSMEVVVMRESSAAHLNLKVFVDQTSPDELNRMADSGFVLEVHHGGYFVGLPKLYLSGKVDFIRNVDSDLMSYFEVLNLVKELGCNPEICNIYHKIPDSYFDGGLKDIKTNTDVVDMFAIHEGRGTISVYVENIGVGLDVDELGIVRDEEEEDMRVTKMDLNVVKEVSI
ncbi:hypothetical protein RHMOL_Rhmol07G0030400 [Rhododendron molle]|uniref:Uncharacterized protein n=1 Tax=Rhododendron molle TaxID=49168 RepID=A0ACC0MW80_RHOML|nr:hypothetical protein RHMOL_Rhmol07G0030400 [Rhododendron molle]